MAQTSFSPVLDGRADWAAMQPADLSPWLLDQVFQQARARVLEALHEPYSNAVETYALDRFTRRWIERAPLKDLARQAGQVYAALDYYHACLPLPGRLTRLGARNAAVFGWYFCQRALDNLRANAAGLLQGLAIAGLIPDDWFPQEALEKIIVAQIQGTGLARAVDVQVDFHLALAPGGLRWLAEASRQAVEKLQAQAAVGQPWPVRLLRSPGGLPGNSQAIVYACQEQPGGGLRLEIFEPGLDLEEHALLVQERGEKVSVMEIAPPARPQAVLGLLWEAYAPAPPPLECSPWWLESQAMRRLWRRARQGGQALRRILHPE